ncbi:hypothetical protein F5X98DRAFT_325349, partial [Xylaria grammica]
MNVEKRSFGPYLLSLFLFVYMDCPLGIERRDYTTPSFVGTLKIRVLDLLYTCLWTLSSADVSSSKRHYLAPGSSRAINDAGIPFLCVSQLRFAVYARKLPRPHLFLQLRVRLLSTLGHLLRLPGNPIKSNCTGLAVVTVTVIIVIVLGIIVASEASAVTISTHRRQQSRVI